MCFLQVKYLPAEESNQLCFIFNIIDYDQLTKKRYDYQLIMTRMLIEWMNHL